MGELIKPHNPEDIILKNSRKDFEPHHYNEERKAGAIYFDDINVLPQARKTFQDIPELAEDIYLNKGLINPLLVAEFNPENCQRHTELMSHLWKEEIDFQNLKSTKNNNGEEKYYVLIGGERRFRAIKYLENQGIDIKEVFPDRKIPVSICDNPPIKIFIRLQFSENKYSKPLPHEEANSISASFNLLKEDEPKYSLTAFSKDIGKDPRTVKKATLFCLAPSFIQNAVKDGYLNYGIACEIAKMEEERFSEQEMNIMARNAMIGRWKVNRCHEEVARKIKNKQQKTFEIFTEADRKKQERLFQQDKSAKELTRGAWEFIRFLRGFNYLVEKKQLGIKDSPFHLEILLKSYLELIKEQEKLLPHLEGVSQQEKRRMQKILSQSKKYTEKIISYKETTEPINLS